MAKIKTDLILKVVKEPNTVNSYFIVNGSQQVATVHEEESIAEMLACAPEMYHLLVVILPELKATNPNSKYIKLIESIISKLNK